LLVGKYDEHPQHANSEPKHTKATQHLHGREFEIASVVFTVAEVGLIQVIVICLKYGFYDCESQWGVHPICCPGVVVRE
jgi:hypothetical protein